MSGKRLKTVLEESLENLEAEFGSCSFCQGSELASLKASFKNDDEREDGSLSFEASFTFSRDPAYKKLTSLSASYSSDIPESVFEQVKAYLEKADKWILDSSKFSGGLLEAKSSGQPEALACSQDFRYKAVLRYSCKKVEKN